MEPEFLLTFKHANLNTEVNIVKSLIFSFYYSESHKCVFIISTGGATIPVKESIEEVKQKMRG